MCTRVVLNVPIQVLLDVLTIVGVNKGRRILIVVAVAECLCKGLE